MRQLLVPLLLILSLAAHAQTTPGCAANTACVAIERPASSGSYLPTTYASIWAAVSAAQNGDLLHPNGSGEAAAVQATLSGHTLTITDGGNEQLPIGGYFIAPSGYAGPDWAHMARSRLHHRRRLSELSDDLGREASPRRSASSSPIRRVIHSGNDVSIPLSSDLETAG